MSVHDDAILPDDFEEMTGGSTPQDDALGHGEDQLPADDDSTLKTMFGMNGDQGTEGDQGQTQTDDSTTSQEGAQTQSQGNEPDFSALLEALTSKAKFNHGSLELKSVEDAIQLIQKGANYDKIKGRYDETQTRLQQLEQDPASSFLKQRAEAVGMSVEQYIQEVQKAEEQDRIQELVAKQIPEEYAREMVEGQKFRKAYQEEQDRKAAEEAARAKQDAETKAFLDYFAFENGRPYNPQEDSIPDDVWTKVNNGTPLKDAYMEYRNLTHKSETAKLQEQITKMQAELEQAKSRQAQNLQNQQRAVVGPVSGHGGSNAGPEDPFLKGFGSL